MFSLANGNASGNKPISTFRSRLIRAHWVAAIRRSLRRPRETPQTASEAVILSVRERRVTALKEPANIERLLDCDDDSRIEINERIACLIAVESRTRWLTPLSEKQRVWLRHIAARLRRAA